MTDYIVKKKSYQTNAKGFRGGTRTVQFYEITRNSDGKVFQKYPGSYAPWKIATLRNNKTIEQEW